MINENQLEDIKTNLEQHIQQLDLQGNPQELYEPITYLMGLGGKRIRPLLTLLAYNLYKEDYKKALSPAAAVEVFHNFTLMHDDIMDNAPLRRGKATVHEKWDDNTAILSGDVMLVKAYDLLLSIAPEYLKESLQLFNKTAAEVCEGQQFDMNFERRELVSEEEYLNMIRLKTAVLLGFALQLGAILAGATKSDAQRLYDFGMNIGIAFQLKDDLLDVYADKEKFGKQVGGDIIANKKTYLLVKAKESATGPTKDELEKWLHAKSFSSEDKVKAVTAIYDQLLIKEKTMAVMEDYFQKGFKQLSELQVKNNKGLQLLQSLTQHLANREK
ncbi:polyprenyl synthetase family protein [Cyclobacterium marinum]|uniref:Polyprenyl synthetase n=1 Tax=Cyclobacterium marinum (strain ATCC 25205 / DSM 745 / LMG 13164 / NCIMB 1802) TaxID=880070 RepID=G0J2K6_CYCMS|nr:polyprenyl synthetase family protein [Cyclobacterium marinum]AEL25897.1 Polyprenyl synthetase [Cyclobacterium marinum DSM 745]MBI0401320.1 polyprenyl synthetase family protein [Cyclobacterium marinum]MBR9775318.1 polyprenyl synthetase family protein [Cytophagales bacterium]|tara:strand:+ start:24962 stop:25948 length:987 start_codon:yes stop_codon:yes gene_type:complete